MTVYIKGQGVWREEGGLTLDPFEHPDCEECREHVDAVVCALGAVYCKSCLIEALAELFIATKAHPPQEVEE